MAVEAPPVAIIMGSQSDWSVLMHAAETLDSLGVAHDDRIVSAHRTPDRLVAFAKGARGAGFKVIIAGAGGAAHLPGMTAAKTPLPVLGVPVQTRALGGIDSLCSIVQMPKGIPVGTLAIGEAGAVNAALLAAAILAPRRRALAGRLDAYREDQTTSIERAPETSMTEPPIPPGGTIGVLGGGQLGRMMALAAARARALLPHLLSRRAEPRLRRLGGTPVAAYDDEASLAAFAEQSMWSPTTSSTCRSKPCSALPRRCRSVRARAASRFQDRLSRSSSSSDSASP